MCVCLVSTVQTHIASLSGFISNKKLVKKNRRLRKKWALTPFEHVARLSPNIGAGSRAASQSAPHQHPSPWQPALAPSSKLNYNTLLQKQYRCLFQIRSQQSAVVTVASCCPTRWSPWQLAILSQMLSCRPCDQRWWIIFTQTYAGKCKLLKSYINHSSCVGGSSHSDTRG